LKCLYYLATTLAATHEISDDLHEVGVRDFYLHVITRDESGLKREHIHSSNYLETLDLVRDGFIGGALGFCAGLAGIALLAYFQPFGPDIHVPWYVNTILVAVATLFGAWEGGLTGVASKNKKLAQFSDEIDAGGYLMLVYVRKPMEAAVRTMMEKRHPDAALVGIDAHFINPFSSVAKIAPRSATTT
jgi:hypothetical protein